MSTVQDVRLKPFEIDAIRSSFRAHFAPEDHLWLFGSRVNPTRRGGDIDLYVETVLDASTAFNSEKAFVVELWNKIGEQKIDVVLNLVTDDYKLAIYEVARAEGVQLV